MKKNIQKNTKGKILLTGGAGYIGSVLTEKLVGKGLKIKVFDKFYFGKESLQHLGKRVDIIEGDIRNIPIEVFTDVETVLHLAGFSNDPMADFDPKINMMINTTATIDLAKKAKEYGIKKFIFASSCSIYDLGLENENGIKDENAIVNPVASYSLSKYKAEREILKLVDDNFCVVILRKGTLFGFSKRMRYDLVVNTMIKNALSQGIIKVFCRGLQWRPLIDIEDVAEAYYIALTSPPKNVNGQIFNITLNNFLVKDLADIVQKTLKKHFSINTTVVFEQSDRKDRSYRVSGTKAKKILLFIPKVSIEKSIVKMVKNIRRFHYTDFDNPRYYNINWMLPYFEKESQSEREK